MDRKTQSVLDKITGDIPEHLAGSVVKRTVDASEELQVREILKSPNLSPKKRRDLQKLLDSGAFRREEVSEDEEVIRQLDEYHTGAVRRARQSGALQDPKKDRFIKERNWRIKNNK